MFVNIWQRCEAQFRALTTGSRSVQRAGSADYSADDGEGEDDMRLVLKSHSPFGGDMRVILDGVVRNDVLAVTLRATQDGPIVADMTVLVEDLDAQLASPTLNMLMGDED